MAAQLPANVNLSTLLALAPLATPTGVEPIESVQTGTSGAFTVNQIVAFGKTQLGVLTLANGGIGTNTLTQNGVVVGNGSGIPIITSQGAANTVLAANAGAPAFTTTPTIGTNINYGSPGTQWSSGGNRLITVLANANAGIAISVGMAIYRDDTAGGAAMVLFDGAATIVSQTGSNFTTTDPGAATSKWFIKSTGDAQNRYAATHQISYAMLSVGGTFP